MSTAQPPPPLDRRRRFLRAVAVGFAVGVVIIGGFLGGRATHHHHHHQSVGVMFAPRHRPVRAQTVKASAPVDRRGCTDVWTGLGDGSQWMNALNWSAKRAPTVNDRACLGPGTVVSLVGESVRVGTVHAEGTLYIHGTATLTLADLSRQSELRALVLADGTLGGDGTVVITALNWSNNGRMIGEGRTVFPKRSVVTFNAGDGGAGLIGSRRSILIRGIFQVAGGALYIDSTAHLTSYGHITVNPYSPRHQPAGLLQRETGQPLRVTRRGKPAPGVVTGTPGRRGAHRYP